MSELTITTVNSVERRLLPILDDYKSFKAEYRTAEAVIQPVDGELRVPYVARRNPGDFKALMDVLTDELNHTRFRFIGTSVPPSEVFTKIGPSDARTIHEAVNGFTEETLREYVNDRGDIEPVETLVGDWKPD
jgi:hypothetical protein